MWRGEWNKTSATNFYTCVMKQIRSTSYVSESSLVFHIFVVPYNNKLVWQGLRHGKEKGILRTGSKHVEFEGATLLAVRCRFKAGLIIRHYNLPYRYFLFSQQFRSPNFFLSFRPTLRDLVNSLTPKIDNHIEMSKSSGIFQSEGCISSNQMKNFCIFSEFTA